MTISNNFILDAHLIGFFTNGKFDNFKFRSFYNLINHEDVKKRENDYFGSKSIILLSKYTDIFKNYKNSKNIKSVMNEVKKLIVKFKAIIDCNSFTVSYTTLNIN